MTKDREMAHYRLRDGVVYRKEDDGALIYDHATGRVTPLNATAAMMCELLFFEQKGIEEVLDGIRTRWRVTDEEQVKSDTESFVIGMKKLNLIEEVKS